MAGIGLDCGGLYLGSTPEHNRNDSTYQRILPETSVK
jgi:hypothetical protein